MQGISRIRNSGVVLPTVLWMTILIIVVASNYASAVHVNTKIADNIKMATILKYDSRSGVYVALEKLLSAASMSNAQYDLEFNNSRLEIEVWPERMKTHINEAGAQKLQDTFIRAGIDPVKAGLLAARVIDWRDADHSVQTFGMEDRAYSAVGKDYGAKDARFEDLAELLLLEGIDDYTFRMIKDYFTVYSNRSGELYSIVSKASKHDGSSSYNTRVIVQLTHQSGSPYRMLKWQHEQD